jgi:ribosomal protein S18 acetylase RimI-like enzyme
VTASSEPVRLTTSQIDLAVEVLARAFFDDPELVYMTPDAARRMRLWPDMYRSLVHYAFLYGDEVYTTPGAVRGVAVWLPPGKSWSNIGGWFRTEAVRAAFRFRIGEIRRALRVLTSVDRVHGRCMTGPHWYLSLLSVEPSCQGQGIGGMLIQPTLARADADGLPCYLETATEKNVRFYRKHGFEVLAEERIPGGGPRFWAMVRNPRR